MECLEAQRLVSERLDSETVDATQLEEAKAHCRTCPECSAYVRALVAIRQSLLPEPASDLPDRVMEAVRAEIALSSAASAPGTEPEATEMPAALTEPISYERMADRIRDPRNRRAILTWLTAAAVVFLIAGIGAMAGVRQILNPTRNAAVMTAETPAPAETAQEYGAAPKAAEDSLRGEAKSPSAAGAAPSYIVVTSLVYALTGDAGRVDESSLATVGTTVSDLDGDTASTRDVLGSGDPSIVYVEFEDGSLKAFKQLKRTFGGRDYGLASGGITTFGTWPSLPPGVSEPTNPDGSPQYVETGTDSNGATVYRAANSDASIGIAVAPGTKPDDPAAGNPGWTWWVPITQ